MVKAGRSDEELMKELQSGSENAIAELESRYYRLVWSICRRILLSSTEAEDAAQEAFVKLWASRDGFRTDRRFWPWFRALALTTCLDRLRVRGRLREVPLEVVRFEVAEAPASEVAIRTFEKVDSAVFRSELRRAFEECWSALPAQKRAFLQFIDWSDWARSASEVAEYRQMNPGAVRMSTIRYARTLVNCLKEKGFCPSPSDLLEVLEAPHLTQEE